MTNNNLDRISSTQLASISGGKAFPDSRWPSPGPGPTFPFPRPQDPTDRFPRPWIVADNLKK